MTSLNRYSAPTHLKAHTYFFRSKNCGLRLDHRIEVNSVSYTIYLRRRDLEPGNLDRLGGVPQIDKQVWRRVEPKDYTLDLLVSAHAAMTNNGPRYTQSSKQRRHAGYCSFGEDYFKLIDESDRENLGY